MSHSFIFMPFRDGETASIPQRDASRLLQAHQFPECTLIDGANVIGTPTTSDGCPIIGDYLFINCSGSDVTEVAIDRPLYDEPCRRLAFAIIADLQLAMMSSGGEILCISPSAKQDFHRDFISQFIDVDTDVTSQEQLFQIGFTRSLPPTNQIHRSVGGVEIPFQLSCCNPVVGRYDASRLVSRRILWI
jgi:hypothetical protein